MSLRNTASAWGVVARLLHWALFLLVVGAWYAVTMHEEFPRGSPERADWMRLHFSFGLTIFVLVWVRLGWRLSGTVPTPVAGPRWQQWAAQLVHAALYLLLIAMPLTGMLGLQLRGRAVPWFGVIEIPPLLDKDRELAETIGQIHQDVLWPLLTLLLVAHVGAALWHHFWLKDDVLRRMTFPRD